MKINKFLVLFIGLFFCLNSSASTMDYLTQNNSSLETIQEKKQKLETLNDFQQLENDLKEALVKGDKAKLVLLGLLYANDTVLTDGNIIKSDFNKSQAYLKEGLKEGFGIASMFIVLFDTLKQGDVDYSLLTLEQGLKAKNNKNSDFVLLAIMYNSLVLEFKSIDVNYVKKALDLTYPISEKTNISTLDFTIANLLNLVGMKEKANIYLNTACNNPNVDPGIQEACNNSIGISNNLKKSEECETCGVIK